jgi:nucleoid-associated protein YgaU
MRKDVKFGFAIGGVLLAVLIVYVLVVPNTDKNGNQVADIGPTPANSSQSPTQSQQTQSNSTGGTSASSSVTKGEAPKPSTPAETPRQTVTPADSAAKPADPFATSSSDQKQAGAETTVASGSNESRGVDWAKILDGGPMPLMSKTSASDESTSSSSASSNDSVAGADRSPREGSSTRLMALSGPASGSGASAPATQPSTGQRTHVIAAHETLSSISAAAYGSVSHWKEIAAANPNINPNKLKTGVTIVLPALATSSEKASSSSSASSSSTPASSTPAKAIDSTREYRVEKNDTLYTISVKLYGKSDRVDKIYELNKEAIGPNPNHLKLNTVLKLPEAPSVASR